MVRALRRSVGRGKGEPLNGHPVQDGKGTRDALGLAFDPEADTGTERSVEKRPRYAWKYMLRSGRNFRYYGYNRIHLEFESTRLPSLIYNSGFENAPYLGREYGNVVNSRYCCPVVWEE